MHILNSWVVTMFVVFRAFFAFLVVGIIVAAGGATSALSGDMSDLIEFDDGGGSSPAASSSDNVSDLIEFDAGAASGPGDKQGDEEDDFGRDSIDDELEADDEEADPFEPVNRFIFAFNQVLQNAIFTPVGKAYRFVIPESMRESLDKAFTNVLSPVYFINYVLQGKGAEATTVVARFLINSTFGMLGLFDVAGHFGIKVPTTGLSQTLAVWGIDIGPYIVLPVLGPSTIRDTLGIVGDWVANPLDYYLRRKSSRRKLRYTYQGLRFINTYADNIDEIERINKESEDVYLAVRSFYLQNLRFKDNEARTTYMADSFSEQKTNNKEDKVDADDDDFDDE